MLALSDLGFFVSLIDLCLALKWSPLGDKEYTVIYESMTWINAQKHCEDLGGGLAQPDTEERNKFLISLTDQTSWLWLGASNAYDRKTWEWHNPFKPMTFKYWASTEPDDLNNQTCLLCWKFNEGYKWGDFYCTDTSRQRGFICQRDRVSSSQNNVYGSRGYMLDRSGQKCITICL